MLYSRRTRYFDKVVNTFYIIMFKKNTKYKKTMLFIPFIQAAQLTSYVQLSLIEKISIIENGPHISFVGTKCDEVDGKLSSGFCLSQAFFQRTHEMECRILNYMTLKVLSGTNVPSLQ